MNQRRGLLQRALVVLSGLAFCSRDVKAEEQDSARKKFKQILRHDGKGWREIQWEEMLVGDQVVCIGDEMGNSHNSAANGHLYLSVSCWTILEIIPAKDTGTPWTGVRCDNTELLPKCWGNL
jgi:hypothetical protein